MSEFENYCRLVEIKHRNDDVRLSGRDFLKLAYDFQQERIDNLQKQNEILRAALLSAKYVVDNNVEMPFDEENQEYLDSVNLQIRQALEQCKELNKDEV